MILVLHWHVFVFSGIQFSLGDKQSSSNMKIDTLSFIQHLLNNQGQLPSVFHPHAPVLVPAIITAVSDPFYKISSEALLVLESLVRILKLLLAAILDSVVGPSRIWRSRLPWCLYLDSRYYCLWNSFNPQALEELGYSVAISRGLIAQISILCQSQSSKIQFSF